MEIAGFLRYAGRAPPPHRRENVSDQIDSDEAILERAQEIKKEKGIPLTEAIDIAATEAYRAASAIDTEFTITLNLKPRVAKFFREEFAGHPELTVEERMAVYIETILNRMRGQALARARKDPEIEQGKAHAVSRSSFLQQTKGLV
jgi:hypothetical protein